MKVNKLFSLGVLLTVGIISTTFAISSTAFATEPAFDGIETYKINKIDDWGTAKVRYYPEISTLFIGQGSVDERSLKEEKPWDKIREEYHNHTVKHIMFENVVFETSKLNNMFYNEKNLETVDMRGVKVESLVGSTETSLISMDSMFENTIALKEVKFTDEMEKNSYSANKMFKNASSLTSINMKNFTRLRDADEMFSGATSLKNVGNFHLGNLYSAKYMFKDTKSLDFLDFGDARFRTGPSSRYENMLEGSELKEFSISVDEVNPEFSPTMSLPDGSWIAPNLRINQTHGAMSQNKPGNYGRHITTDDLRRNGNRDIVYASHASFPNFFTSLTYERGAAYTVRYHENDGTNKVTYDENDIKLSTEFFNLNKGPILLNKESNLVKKGFFNSWNTEKDGSGKAYRGGERVSDLTNENGKIVELYAQYNSAPYKVKFNPNVEESSSVSGSMKDKSIEAGQEYVIDNNQFNRKGYKFLYWTTTKDDIEQNRIKPGEVVKDLADPGEEVTLYAQWGPIHYDILYTNPFAFNSKNAFESDSYVQNMTYDVEEPLANNQFSRTGYLHMGWSDQTNPLLEYLNQQVVKNLADVDEAEVPFLPKWQPIKYHVKFDKNTGNGSMDSKYYEYDKKEKLPKNTFTKTAYIFAGWSTDKDAKEPMYGNEEEVQNLTNAQDDTVTLYAVWVRDRLAEEMDKN